MSTTRFAIALSFPSKHRSFVQKVAESLADSIGGDKVFYDKWYEVELTGRNGDQKLQKVYSKDSMLVVPFFSEHYSTQWCGLEWDAIRGIFLDRKRSDSVIP